MEWLEQLSGASVEVDQRVEGPCLGDPIDDAEVEPGIVISDLAFNVRVGELSDSKSESKNTS